MLIVGNEASDCQSGAYVWAAIPMPNRNSLFAILKSACCVKRGTCEDISAIAIAVALAVAVVRFVGDNCG